MMRALTELLSSYPARLTTAEPVAQAAAVASSPEVVVEQWALYDSARQRPVPVVLCRPVRRTSKTPLTPAIISPGYGGRHTDYLLIT